jgi:CheY-like chemotaxis protein
MTKSLPRVIVMEDNPADVLLIREALQEQGVEADLVVVPDGEAALEWVSAGAPADLILLDLNLPRHDGIEVLEKIRATHNLRDVPVAVFSSSDSPQDRAGAEQLGADRFIAKPCTLDEFLLVGRDIKAMLSRRSLREEARRPAAAGPALTAQPDVGAGSNSEP